MSTVPRPVTSIVIPSVVPTSSLSSVEDAIPQFRCSLMFPKFKGTALFSKDRRYRYRLGRTWDSDKPKCIFIMLNPSTATAEKNDPSVRRCMGFAQREGCGELEVINLFALRSTDPKQLYLSDDPIGPENNYYMRLAVKNAKIIVAAWGSHGHLYRRGEEICRLLEGTDLLCLGVTKDGHPKHPLYISATTPLLFYSRHCPTCHGWKKYNDYTIEPPISGKICETCNGKGYLTKHNIK